MSCSVSSRLRGVCEIPLERVSDSGTKYTNSLRERNIECASVRKHRSLYPDFFFVPPRHRPMAHVVRVADGFGPERRFLLTRHRWDRAFVCVVTGGIKQAGGIKQEGRDCRAGRDIPDSSPEGPLQRIEWHPGPAALLCFSDVRPYASKLATAGHQKSTAATLRCHSALR